MEEEKQEVLEETSAEVKAEAVPEILSEIQDEELRKSKPLNKKFILVLVVIVAGALFYNGYKNDKFGKVLGVQTSASMSVQEAEDFVNENLMQDGTGATVTEVTEENGLYKIKLTVGEQEYIAYLTKDKTKFFPQAIDIAEIQQQKADAEAAAVAEEEASLTSLTKTDKPIVELFVMSHCPYGTQMEKGIIPVVKALGDKIDFQLKFCDYAMHDKKELDEEMNQYCISQNEPSKLISYLECFLADETSSAKCVAQVGIDSAKMASCVAATDSQYGITAGYDDKSTWKSETYPSFPIYQEDVTKYAISGSPSLVINGSSVSSKRDSASLLQYVCAGFSEAPEECSQVLSSTAPSAGFGYAEGTDTGASCE
ncbi:MAG: hypothetical protein WC178_00160 [Candidatus Paceibacterota bacterium]